jgi:hypothetical protein
MMLACVCVMLAQVHFRSCCMYLLYGELLSVSESIWARNWMNPEKLGLFCELKMGCRSLNSVVNINSSMQLL